MHDREHIDPTWNRLATTGPKTLKGLSEFYNKVETVKVYICCK